MPPDAIAPPPLPDWLARMLPFRRSIHDVGGARMHVMEAGEGTPVVMLHGNPTWGFLYRKVAAALAGAPLRLIMPDLVGLGLSERVDASFHRLDRHVAQLSYLYDALGLDRFVFVGQDWGGPIGVGALREPSRALGLVVLNTVLSPPRPGFRPTLFHRLARTPIVAPALFRGLGFPQRVLWLPQGDRQSIRGEVLRAYRWPLEGLRNNAAPLALARMVPDSDRHPSIPALRRVQEITQAFEGPAAIVWGDRDPVLSSVRKWMQHLLPRATMTRTDAGHFLQEEVPELIAGAILEVVRKAELVALLEAHLPQDDREAFDRDTMKRHAVALAAPFSRKEPTAHFTGSAVVVDRSGARVCMVHHAKLHKWLQPGGHAEPIDAGSMASTALREAHEETGCHVSLHPRAPRPIDLDVHAIPARKDEGAHEHLDVRYLVVAEDPEALAHRPDESHDARWLSWGEALGRAPEGDVGLRRLLEKARRVCGA